MPQEEWRTLKHAIVEGWAIARALQDKHASGERVIKRLTALYRKYITLRGRKLPDLTEYRRNIVEGTLKELPVLAI